jgi:uncharacterized heparinase superfamily protein
LSAVNRHGAQLWGMVAREAWRRLRRRLRVGPVYRWRYAGRTPERVLIAPPDLRTADPQVAADFYSGRFPLAGRMVEAQGVSPFSIAEQHDGWVAELSGFRWLRHMREAGTELAAANARVMVADWIALHDGRIAGAPWRADVTSRRIIAWLQHSAIVLQGADFGFYRRFMKSLAAQVRYLRSMTPEMPCDEERLRARVALAFAALSLPVSPAAVRTATRNLDLELERQIHPDGGHVSRNPGAILELLADLLPLRQTYANQAEAPPPALLNAIDRMLPALRFFRHGDGSLARFNGMGATMQDRVAAVLRLDDTVGSPLLQAPHSGYQRLALGGTTVIADTGTPPPPEAAADAHAGCLSFELSSGRQCFVVNCGIDRLGATEFRRLARTTAAHSTAAINDASSCRFNGQRGIDALLVTPLIAGPRKVACRRLDGRDSQGFVASHDGYAARFGLHHERELVLGQEGSVLDGTDRFYRQGGAAPDPRAGHRVAIRFHLHPQTELFLDQADRLVIAGQHGEGWLFTCDGMEPAIEESIFFAGSAGPRKSRQIVLSFEAADFPEVQWRMTRVALRDNDAEG